MSETPITIKKYANRRLYNTGTSSYVTLDDLAEMVKINETFVVVDAKSGEDITRAVLTQIIVEQESRGGNLLPINFLRQLISFYGDSMQNLVPSYLDFSMESLAREQGRYREEMTRTLGETALTAMEDQVKRNMTIYENAMRMFVPFGTPGAEGTEGDAQGVAQGGAGKPQGDKPENIDDLKRELADMQGRIDKMSKK